MKKLLAFLSLLMLCACTNTNSLSKGFSIDDINNIIVTHKTDIDEKLSELHSSGKLLDVILLDSSTVTPDDTYNDHKEDIDTVIANHNRIVSLLNEILNNNPQKTDNKVKKIILDYYLIIKKIKN